MRGLLALLLLSLVSGSAAAECQPSQWAVDKPDDTTFMGREDHPFDAPPPTEALQAVLWIENDALHANLTLVAPPPRGNPFETYRYWINFDVVPEGGEAEKMGFRVGATTTYEEVALVGPNSMGNPTFGTYPLSWEGGTVSTFVPLADLERAYGKPVVVGRPTGLTDGPSRSDQAQGSPFGAVFYDFYGDPFAPFVPLCRAQAGDGGPVAGGSSVPTANASAANASMPADGGPAASPADPAPRGAPGLTPLAFLGLLAVAALRRQG